MAQDPSWVAQEPRPNGTGALAGGAGARTLWRRIPGWVALIDLWFWEENSSKCGHHNSNVLEQRNLKVSPLLLSQSQPPLTLWSPLDPSRHESGAVQSSLI